MPRYDLAAIARRANPGMRRRSIVLRDIAPPGTLATDLYRATYLPVVQAWTAALPRIEAEYGRTLAETAIRRDSAFEDAGCCQGVADGKQCLETGNRIAGSNPALLLMDSPADVKAEIDGAAEHVNRLLMILTPELRDWALRVEKWQRGKWRGAVLSAAGVDLETMLGPEDVRTSLETHIQWNTALIKDVSAQAQQRISTAVFDGLRNRTPAREVAKSIREAVDMGKDRSIRIASDQLNKITSALADERRREAGITAWEWVHSRKAHPRANHVARDGNYYSDDPGDVGSEINGKKLLAPPDDRPGQLPYCGCRSRSVIDMSD